jgi:hypothetical protein
MTGAYVRGDMGMSSSPSYSGSDLVTLLDALRQSCQDVTARSIQASAEACQWRARLATPHQSRIRAELTAAYHLRAVQDEAFWRRLRHQWACRYATTAVEVNRAVLTGPPDAHAYVDVDTTGGAAWSTATTTSCPTLPDPTELTTGSPTGDVRIVQAHQAVTEATDAVALVSDLEASADVPAEVARTAEQLTDRILTYSTVVHAAVRAQINTPRRADG